MVIGDGTGIDRLDSGLSGSGSVNNYSINTTDHNGETIKLRFDNLLAIKAHIKEKDVSQVINYMTLTPDVSDIEKFLGTLSKADSFRLLVELLKYDTFFFMASATPFKGTDDLHSIDHIIRGVVPAYTSSCMALRGTGKSNPSGIVDASEYSTVFLEDIVKLLGNKGYFVSRSISLENVESSDRCDCSHAGHETHSRVQSQDSLAAAHLPPILVDTGSEYLPLELIRVKSSAVLHLAAVSDPLARCSSRKFDG
ncbi:hypothetical protein O3P69_001785 [Scylla paramamosain]|uniref:Uncharacterized protein n=1 Tax=Scylla paramamosain TaxID=85552 RepID=A0AAW0UZB5_SCYPA